MSIFIIALIGAALGAGIVAAAHAFGMKHDVTDLNRLLKQNKEALEESLSLLGECRMTLIRVQGLQAKLGELVGEGRALAAALERDLPPAARNVQTMTNLVTKFRDLHDSIQEDLNAVEKENERRAKALQDTLHEAITGGKAEVMSPLGGPADKPEA